MNVVKGRLVLISNTRRKLKAAGYHLRRMRETQSDADPNIFEYELEAFLSAARSITSLPEPRKQPDQWYLEKEFGHRPNFQQWYDKKVNELATDTAMHFLNSERNIVIHYNRQSMHIRSDTHISTTEHVVVSDSVTVSVLQENGTTETISPPPPERKSGFHPDSYEIIRLLQRFIKRKPTETAMERVWFFDTSRISGDKKVITVCEEHLEKLSKLIDEVERL